MPSPRLKKTGINAASKFNPTLSADARFKPWFLKSTALLEKLTKTASKIKKLKTLGPKGLWKVDVAFVDEVKMKELNLKFRFKNHATDILSFHGPEPFYSMGYLGELVICLPIMEKQAKELKLKPETELAVLLVHGLLHLLGFDHERGDKEAKEMLKYERQLLVSVLDSKSKNLGLIERNS